MAESLSIALAPHLGPHEAQRVVQAACKRTLTNGSTLRRTAVEDQQILALLSAEAIDRALSPAAYFGSADRMIDRALAVYREAQSMPPALEDA